MATQTITVEVPEALYRSMHRLAAATHQRLETIVRESLEHSLPPLEDVPEEDAAALAALSSLGDPDLWREARATLAPEVERELDSLLERQGAGKLTTGEHARLQSLLETYGQLMVRKAHAWLGTDRGLPVLHEMSICRQ
jgi:predicted DNA-binding protein